MAFSEAERVQVRRWLGFPAIFQQAEPRLENALTSVQSIADGGSRPDNSTEVAIRGYLTTLATIESQELSLLTQMQALKADNIGIDPVRGMMGLRQIGRRYVRHLADALATSPRGDAWSAAKAADSGVSL
jgi:hypothetical protein